MSRWKVGMRVRSRRYPEAGEGEILHASRNGIQDIAWSGGFGRRTWSSEDADADLVEIADPTSQTETTSTFCSPSDPVPTLEGMAEILRRFPGARLPNLVMFECDDPYTGQKRTVVTDRELLLPPIVGRR